MDPEIISPMACTERYPSEERHPSRSNSRSARREAKERGRPLSPVESSRLRGLERSKMRITKGPNNPGPPGPPDDGNPTVFDMAEDDSSASQSPSRQVILPESVTNPNESSSSDPHLRVAERLVEQEKNVSQLKQQVIIATANDTIAGLRTELEKVEFQSARQRESDNVVYEHNVKAVRENARNELAASDVLFRQEAQSVLIQAEHHEQSAVQSAITKYESLINQEAVSKCEAIISQERAEHQRALTAERSHVAEVKKQLEGLLADERQQQQRLIEAEKASILNLRQQLENERSLMASQHSAAEKVMNDRLESVNKRAIDEMNKFSVQMEQMANQNQMLMERLTHQMAVTQEAERAHQAAMASKDQQLEKLIQEFSMRPPEQVLTAQAAVTGTVTRATVTSSSMSSNPGGSGPPGGDPAPDKGDPNSHKDKDESDRKGSDRRNKGNPIPSPPDPPNGDEDDVSSDDPADKSKSRRSSVMKADDIVLPTLPEPAAFHKWRAEVRNKVKAASQDPDKAFEWIIELEDSTASVERFADCPKRFLALDAKLDEAVDKLLSNSVGDLSKRVFNFKEINAKRKIPSRGRQTLFMVYDSFATDRASGILYDLEDLFSIQLVNDRLESFLNRWDGIIIHLSEPPEEKLLDVIFGAQIKKSTKMKVHWEAYQLADKGTEKRTYNYLYQAAHNIVLRERRERARRKAVGDKPGLGMAAGTSGGAGKGPDNAVPGSSVPPNRGRPSDRLKPADLLCYYYSAGHCVHGSSCKFSHDESKCKVRADKPRSKSRARSPSVSVHKCVYYDGTDASCPYGSSCRFRHDKDNPEPTKTKDAARSASPGKGGRRKGGPKGKGGRRKGSPNGGKAGRSPRPKAKSRAHVAAEQLDDEDLEEEALLDEAEETSSDS